MQDLRLPNEYEGQLSLFDYFEEQRESNPLIAVSKIFASAKKQMNLPEWKIFVLALTYIKWKKEDANAIEDQSDNPNKKGIVALNKKEVAEKLGITSDDSHISQDLKRAIGKIPKHSFIEFESNDGWTNGNFISWITFNKKNKVFIKFQEDYLPLFKDLENDYMTMWAEDLFSMSSERSIIFYEELRLHSDTSKENSKIYGIKELKQMFNIPKEGKGSYMRANNHFDRTAFEKRIIDPLCDDLKKCSMVNLTTNEDGKLYRKVKTNKGKVLGYEFQWVISTHPKVATAKEVKSINQHPQELKVAKDILSRKKRNSTNTFNDFPQRKNEIDENLLIDN